jgi:hypothetical protein
MFETVIATRPIPIMHGSGDTISNSGRVANARLGTVDSGSGNTIPNSGRVANARLETQRPRGPRQCDSGLAEGRPLSKWDFIERVERNLTLFGFIGIKDRPSSDIGRELGGDARKLRGELNQRCS